MTNTEFKKAIENSIRENGLSSEEKFEINSNYGVNVDGKEKYQVVSEDDIDEFCEGRKDYDGYPCVSFEFNGKDYFFVKQ